MSDYFWLFIGASFFLYLVARAFERWILPLFYNPNETLEAREAVLRTQIEDLEQRLRESEAKVKASEEKIAAMQKVQDILFEQLDEARSKMMDLQRQVDTSTRHLPQSDVPATPLLVAVGADSMLSLDLAALRAVETETGMEFRRIQDASLRDIKQHLDRGRLNGRPYDKLHLSVHASSEGILLGGKVINSIELSEILRGIRILVIAGCESSHIGDYLGVVPYVVTLSEKVSNSDASLFARAFWTEIGRKKDSTEALRLALLRAPSGVGEFVERHWG